MDMNADERLRASIRTLGLSRFGFWWMRTFGRKVCTGECDGWLLTYIEWRGERYVWVQ